MRLVLIIATYLTITGCAGFSRPPEDIYRIQKHVNDRFSYVSDQAKWGVGHFDEGLVTGNKPFSGDCEEYATAIKYQLESAGKPAQRWMVMTKKGQFHAVTCMKADVWCLDNIERIPVKKDALRYVWMRQL